MRLSLDQLSVDNASAGEPSESEPAFAGISASPLAAKTKSMQPSSTASPPQEFSEKLPTDDWGEFLGD